MPKANFASVVSTFVFCFLFWVLVTWSLAAQELIAGAVVSLAVALFSARFLIHKQAFYLFNPLKFLALVFYCLITFLWELLKANIDVAKRALSPKIKVNPGIVKIPTSLESEYGLAMLANSITLTPGTITMDVVEEDGKHYYYIHWIDVATTDPEQAAQAIAGTLEKGVKRVWR